MQLLCSVQLGNLLDLCSVIDLIWPLYFRPLHTNLFELEHNSYNTSSPWNTLHNRCLLGDFSEL